MTVNELKERMYDPTVNPFDRNYRVLNVVRDLYNEFPDDPDIRELTEQTLLRLRVESPFVYAVTIGQFPHFRGIHKRWKLYGYVDPRGFTWAAPALYGPYMNRDRK